MALKFAVNNSLSAITSLPSGISGGALNLISTQTASASATIDFTSGIDSTYDSYVFKFYDIHPSTNSANFTFQADTGTNTNYNLTITSTSFEAYHTEADDDTGLTYNATRDQAQGTAFAHLGCGGTSSDNDSSMAGTLQIFNPSSSTFVKQYLAVSNSASSSPFTGNNFMAGYFNLTTPITRVRFKFSSGNIDDGIIKMYGVK
jgi:hypothetical protein